MAARPPFQPEPGKVKFSRAADLWLCLPASAKLPEGIPAAAIAGKPYIPALFSLSRTAFRRAGTALINHAKFSHESLCERTFRFETKQEIQRGGTNRYYVPILRHLGDEGRNTPQAVVEFKQLCTAIAGNTNRAALPAA